MTTSHYIRISTLVFLFLFLSCGPIPTDPNDSLITDGSDKTYTNEAWGFQISRPDSTWGLNVQTLEQVREANGLAWVEVRMFRSPKLGEPLFQPTLYLKPSALSRDATLESLVTDLEEELQTVFPGYTAGEKRTMQVRSDTAIEWQFRTRFSSSRSFLLGDRFLVTAVLHDSQGYLMLGSGVSGAFPLETYRQIASSLVFLP